MQKSTLQERHAFTLIELLVVITIIAVLAGLAVAVMQRATMKGRTIKCFNNLRQLGIAALNYAGNNDMTLPATTHQRRSGIRSWSITLQEYAGGKLVFRCPEDEHKTRAYTYVMNDFLTPNPEGAPEIDFSKLTRLERQSETVLFAEASVDYNTSDHFHFSDYKGTTLPPEVFEAQVGVKRHAGAANYLFADGHVETLTWEQVRVRLAEAGSRFVDPTIQPEL
jgi:prepilin-type N-terminal cleavage/methylation domain-containing protein/prepilin-type processing-associated H-X9-DG protein